MPGLAENQFGPMIINLITAYLVPVDMITFIAGGKRTLDTVREALAHVHPTTEQRGARNERLVFQHGEVHASVHLCPAHAVSMILWSLRNMCGTA